MTRRAKAKKKAAPRTKSKPTGKAAKKSPPKTLSLGEPALRWLDSVADSIEASGGPRFRREDILQALVDVNSTRTFDPRTVTSLESLRNAFGAVDLSAVERGLQERTKLEPSVLAALKDSIK